MEDTIEKEPKIANVRFAIPVEVNDQAHKVKRLLQAKNNEDLTVVEIYIRAMQIGLNEIEKSAA